MTENGLEALALVEVESIARGYVVMDTLAKRARVSVKWARAVTPGKFLILFAGDIANTQEAMDAAQEAAGSSIIGSMLLPQVHSELLAAIGAVFSKRPLKAVAILEFNSVWSSLEGADRALKAAEVGLLRMQLAAGIGGKGYFLLVGTHADVLAACECIQESSLKESLVGLEIIPNPQPDISGFFK